ncbi:MAG: PAS domain S-box protein [Bacteroidetes bacterium]|nr:PAS domain S-box protein [Bacteroidota bacterium]
MIVIRNILSDYLEPYEAIGVKKDGTRFPVEIQGKLYEYKGKTIRVTSIRDITQRKKTQQEIKNNEIKFRTIFESVEYGILVAGLDKKNC